MRPFFEDFRTSPNEGDMIFLKIWVVRGRFDRKIFLEATELRLCAKKEAILFCE